MTTSPELTTPERIDEIEVLARERLAHAGVVWAKLAPKGQEESKYLNDPTCRIADGYLQLKAELDAINNAQPQGSHVGYSMENECWFARFYGFKTETQTRAFLAAHQSYQPNTSEKELAEKISFEFTSAHLDPQDERYWEKVDVVAAILAQHRTATHPQPSATSKREFFKKAADGGIYEVTGCGRKGNCDEHGNMLPQPLDSADAPIKAGVAVIAEKSALEIYEGKSVADVGADAVEYAQKIVSDCVRDVDSEFGFRASFDDEKATALIQQYGDARVAEATAPWEIESTESQEIIGELKARNAELVEALEGSYEILQQIAIADSGDAEQEAFEREVFENVKKVLGK